MGAPEDDDDLVSRAPPPPDDRLWRHPSEIDWHIGRPPPPLVTVRPPAAERGRWLIGLAAAAVAIALTVGAVSLVSRDDPGSAAALKEFGRRPAALVEQGPDAFDAEASVVASGPAARVNGAALAVRADGYLVTSAWLVAGAVAVDVMLSDGTIHAARLVGSDPTTDVAVLHIDVDDLKPAALAIADEGDTVEVPRVGQATIVDADATVITADGKTLYGLLHVQGLPEDVVAGAPILDGDGLLLGLSSGAAGGGGVYAVPARLVAAVAADIVEHGRPQIALLGVEGRDSAPSDRGRLGLTGGAVVGRVVPGSPADEAGVEVDDVIVAVDGEPVTSMGALIVLVRLRDPGDEVILTVIRAGSPAKLSATLTERS
ncbi:MAG: S1C family serine protease [Acidimicrobiales bacterium]